MARPRRYSRHSFTAGLTIDEVQRLSDREPFSYRNFTDTRVHIIVEGDTLQHLAGVYFSEMPRACGLWWIIADFQPAPIHDPTLALTPGATLLIPSLRTVQERIFDRQRRVEAVP